MIPELRDFTDKHGFRDGSAVEDRDSRARDEFISVFNHKSKSIRAIAWDRPGMHNTCMLVFFKRVVGWKPIQYIQAWNRHEIIPIDPAAVRLPGRRDLDSMIARIYEFMSWEG